MNAMCDTSSIACGYVEPQPTCPPRLKRNDHLSVSRLKMYTQCPASYEHRYVKRRGSSKSAPTEFGKLLHQVMEDVYRWVIDTEFSGIVPLDMVLGIYQGAWKKYELTDVSVYQEGTQILRDYFRKHSSVDHFSILSVEQEFNYQIDEFVVNGYIDRVDKIDDETVQIIDYKSNRMLFSREEMDTDLQASMYALVARVLWPWAKRYEFAFHMLRHQTVVLTTRTLQQLEDCAAYVAQLGRETEEVESFPERLNPNCPYCDYREICGEFARAIAGGTDKFAYNSEDLESVAAARERAHKVAKINYARKATLEELIRPHLAHSKELILPGTGVKYRLIEYAKDTFVPAMKAVSLVASYAGAEAAKRLEARAQVAPSALEELLDGLAAEGNKSVPLLRLELEHITVKTMGQRFDAQAVKKELKSTGGGGMVSTRKT